MKKSLLFIAVIATLVTIPAYAGIRGHEASEPEYMMNSGYSKTTAEDVFMLKNRANGKPIEPLYEHSNNFVIKTWKGFWAYFDPSRENSDRLHHDIMLTPSYTDL